MSNKLIFSFAFVTTKSGLYLVAISIHIKILLNVAIFCMAYNQSIHRFCHIITRTIYFTQLVKIREYRESCALKCFFKYSLRLYLQEYKNNPSWCSVFQGFSKSKSANGGSILSLSQFLILPQLPQKIKLASKVVKVDSKIIISLPLI